jgi:hypothetical protein
LYLGFFLIKIVQFGKEIIRLLPTKQVCLPRRQDGQVWDVEVQAQKKQSNRQVKDLLDWKRHLTLDVPEFWNLRCECKSSWFFATINAAKSSLFPPATTRLRAFSIPAGQQSKSHPLAQRTPA